MSTFSDQQLSELKETIRGWGAELGFQQITIAGINLTDYEPLLADWIENEYHGAMDYMARNHDKRCHPEQLVPGTLRVICTRMDYSRQQDNDFAQINSSGQAYISRYARGRDYHKLIRKRLQQLADRIGNRVGEFGYRAFVDSAPVLERALAEQSGMGWIGKNTMLINRNAGSWFFLGELYTDLPLPLDDAETDHCGSCRACLDVCPTNAFVAPNLLDARRCISYLTIELRDSIPEALRPLMGNRIFGCDDCQLVCPWNKFARITTEEDFSPRHNLDDSMLVDLFQWTEDEFMERTAGSAIRRIGYECWLRNIAVALGNAITSADVLSALQSRKDHHSALVREHVAWALEQHSVNNG